MSLHHGTEEGQWYTEKLLPRHWERVLGVSNSTLHRWRKCGWLEAHWHPQSQRWVVRADEAELERLKQRCALPSGAESRQMWLNAQTSQPTALSRFSNA